VDTIRESILRRRVSPRSISTSVYCGESEVGTGLAIWARSRLLGVIPCGMGVGLVAFARGGLLDLGTLLRNRMQNSFPANGEYHVPALETRTQELVLST